MGGGALNGKNGGKTESYSGPRGGLIGPCGRKWIKGKGEETEDNCHFFLDPHLAGCDLASSGAPLPVNRSCYLYAVTLSYF